MPPLIIGDRVFFANCENFFQNKSYETLRDHLNEPLKTVFTQHIMKAINNELNPGETTYDDPAGPLIDGSSMKAYTDTVAQQGPWSCQGDNEGDPEKHVHWLSEVLPPTLWQASMDPAVRRAADDNHKRGQVLRVVTFWLKYLDMTEWAMFGSDDEADLPENEEEEEEDAMEEEEEDLMQENGEEATNDLE